MRKFPLISCTLFGLALSFGLVACGGDDGGSTENASSGDGDGDGDGDGTGDGDPSTSGDGDPTTTGDGDACPYNDDPDQIEPCLRLVDCLGVILPEQQQAAADLFGLDGSCWCGSEADAIECVKTCEDQVAAAVTQNPTVGECHGRYCPLEELDPTQPYGPVINGACPDGQTPVTINGFPGSYCAPACSGIAEFCPGHTQSNGNGFCALTQGDPKLCALTCFLDPYEQLGTQCPCGATCQPGAGAGMGICTFE